MASSMQEFTLSRDGAVKRSTTLVVVICLPILAFCATIPLLFPVHGNHPFVYFLLMDFILPATLFGVVLFVPWSYRMDDKEILISRWGPNVHIPFERIESVEPIERKALGGTLKIAGNAGLLGYVGYFTSSIGTVRMYTTRKDRLVLIRFRDGKKPMVLSPDDRDRFVDAAQAGLDATARRSPAGRF